MHGLHDFGIDSDAHHQERSPAIDNRRVKDSHFPAMNDFRQRATATAETQISGQEIFSPEWQHSDGDAGMSIHKVSHSSITARRDDAPKNALGWLFCQVAIQLRTA
jgi:hypothetical protein